MQSDTSAVLGLNSYGQNKYSFGQGTSLVAGGKHKCYRDEKTKRKAYNTICDKADAKNQMLSTVCQKKKNFKN